MQNNQIFFFFKIIAKVVREYDQEKPQSQTAQKTMAS